jgi:NAD(P)-dependent dehydrogenase (short-subunit alcohol dehydrogenase family)
MIYLSYFRITYISCCREKLLALENEIPNSKGYVCDASDSVAVHATVSNCINDLGGVDVLIYNVGSGAFKGFDETTEEEFEKSWSNGPKGLFSFTKALMPHFLSKETGGVIGVTGATASWRGMPTTSAFASSKFATRGLCQSLAREFGPKNVHVFHVIIDGIVDLPKARQWMPNKPSSEFLDPAYVADLYWYLTNQDKRCWSYEVSVGPGDAAGSMVTI